MSRKSKRTPSILPSPNNKKIEVMEVDDDVDELSKFVGPSSNQEVVLLPTEHPDIFYHYVPSGKDVTISKKTRSGEELLTKGVCKGCEAEFAINGESDQKRFINHCLKECKMYDFISLKVHCGICDKWGMDIVSRDKHILRQHQRYQLETRSTKNKQSSIGAIPVIGIDDDEIVLDLTSDGGEDGDGDVSQRKKRKEVPLVLNTDSTPVNNDKGSSHLHDICLDYIPDVTSGDVVNWKTGNKHDLLTAVCKGCKKIFNTIAKSEFNTYITHCIKECPEYQSLGFIKYCYPCNIYCMDQEAFLEHVETSKSCPAHECLTFNNNNKVSTEATGRITEK